MKNIITVLLCALIGACATPQHTQTPAPVMPMLPPSHDYAGGAIYSAGHARALFEDLRARHVGDLVTVILTERTDASKSSSTSTSKTTSFGIGAGTLLDQTITESSVDSSKEFEGGGASSQNNRLSGSLTAVVVDVLPNGLMVIEGHKDILINNGREFLQVRGLVRPLDIDASNTVPSTRIANAQIAFSGRGALASASREGWLTRVFGSVISPL